MALAPFFKGWNSQHQTFAGECQNCLSYRRDSGGYGWRGQTTIQELKLRNYLFKLFSDNPLMISVEPQLYTISVALHVSMPRIKIK